MPEHFVAGAGPLVSAMHPADLYTQGTAELLAGACGGKVVCVNPPELGELETMVDALEAFRRSQSFPAWVFWGLSGGGFLGLLYAHRHPQAVRGLILESTCACFRERLRDAACLFSPANPAWSYNLPTSPLATDATGWTRIAGIGEIYAPDGEPRLISPLPVEPRMRAVMPYLFAYDARALLQDIAVPALVIQGTADPVVPTSHARALCEALPNARWIAIEDGGHVPSASGNTSAHAAVRAFLAAL